VGKILSLFSISLTALTTKSVFGNQRKALIYQRFLKHQFSLFQMHHADAADDVSKFLI
jgi:hypothetical protein